MRRAIGVSVTDRVVAGVVEDHRQSGKPFTEPVVGCTADALLSLPAEGIVECIGDLAVKAAGGQPVAAVGVGFPGVIRHGVVEESPNLQQVKGTNMRRLVTELLHARGVDAPVSVYNDADIVAAGLAGTRGQLDRMVRVWTLGNGIGYGQYPWTKGMWEGGHMVVSLDPKERFCGCGGVGHLEGIMGHRAMRLRFLDLEPEEVFAQAAQGDMRCAEFVSFWHRALAAATASMIHLSGPGKFFITGPNSKHVDMEILGRFLNDMVKMSPFQGYVFEVVPSSDEIAIVGAALNADRTPAE
jgi:glucokinase